MKFSNGLVLVNGILFIGFGLGFILAPVFFFTLFTDGQLTTPSAMRNIRLGLVGSLIVLAAIVIGRITGIALSGHANTFMYVFLAAELAFFLATWYALRMSNNENAF